MRYRESLQSEFVGLSQPLKAGGVVLRMNLL